MATPATPQPMTPDDAFSAFKQAEGAYTSALGSQTSAASALAAAQDSKTQADQALATNAAAVKTAADNLIVALQTFEGGLSGAAPAQLATLSQLPQ